MNVSNFIANFAVNCNATNSIVAFAEYYFGLFRVTLCEGA
jgi:hypothetical protein